MQKYKFSLKYQNNFDENTEKTYEKKSKFFGVLTKIHKNRKYSTK